MKKQRKRTSRDRQRKAEKRKERAQEVKNSQKRETARNLTDEWFRKKKLQPPWATLRSDRAYTRRVKEERDIMARQGREMTLEEMDVLLRELDNRQPHGLESLALAPFAPWGAFEEAKKDMHRR